jgi:hypothetical protein
MTGIYVSIAVADQDHREMKGRDAIRYWIRTDDPYLSFY